MSENLDNNNNTTEPTETVETTNEPSLDDFETEFFSSGNNKAPVKKPDVEETVEEEDSVEKTTSEETNSEEDTDDEEETSSNDDDTSEEETPKKESRAEKRIRELNAKYREEERKRMELEELLRNRDNKTSELPKTGEEEKPKSKENNEEIKPPHWDDEDAEGNKIYPLGQFDPKFNSDLVRYTIREEQQQFQKQQAEKEQARKIQEAEKAVQQQWEEKLAPARERYPDFQERGQELIDQFSDLEPNYAKYLTDTIRSIDNGPDILYHLASNPELANEIVRRGPALASVELGRLSVQFDTNDGPKTKNTSRTKVTNAPPPPPTTRGTSAPKKKDLDNLDDFESVFFKGN